MAVQAQQQARHRIESSTEKIAAQLLKTKWFSDKLPDLLESEKFHFLGQCWGRVIVLRQWGEITNVMKAVQMINQE